MSCSLLLRERDICKWELVHAWNAFCQIRVGSYLYLRGKILDRAVLKTSPAREHREEKKP
jgi:hypothetical protein